MARRCVPSTIVLFIVILVALKAISQNTVQKSDLISCSPAPCILPPTQASEGGRNGVMDAAIVADPQNSKHLLIGSYDFNCYPLSGSGFHLSSDGGSTWTHTCMPEIITRDYVFGPGGDPMVGFDRNGVAYIADAYGDHEGHGIGLVAFQKSTDGVDWTQPRVALSALGTFAYLTWLAVDTNVGSPFLNSIYISGVLVGPPGDNGQNRVVVAASHDGGETWEKAAAEPVQNYPASDAFTHVAVGKDGTVYLTWQRCAGSGPAAACNNGKAYMLFSKSSDGGRTWSRPVLVTEITIAPGPCTCYVGVLPNTNDIRADNYPVIDVDNSNGSYAGNLYVTMYSWTGTYMRVGVVRSTDGGDTWSKPVPIAPGSANHDQFFPWLSVSPTGLVAVSWLDRRNDPANVKYQAFAAISRDGGQTFQPNVLLTAAFSDPNANGANDWMGDYTGNTWAGSDFLAAWMDSSNGFVMQDLVGGIRLKWASEERAEKHSDLSTVANRR